jgi:hypothetical protein
MVLRSQRSYYILVDGHWQAATCVSFGNRRWGFHTVFGLMREDNPRIKVLGLVPPPEGMAPQTDGPDEEGKEAA